MTSKFIKTITLILVHSLFVSILLTGCDFELTLSNSSSAAVSATDSFESLGTSSSTNGTSFDSTSSDPSVSEDVSSDTSSETSSEESRVILTPPPKQDTSLHGLTINECNEFFNDSIFIGDSFMEGFKSRYQSKISTSPDYFGKITLLATRNYGFANAHVTMAEGKKTYHPVYNGEQRYVWEVIGEVKPERVFIMLGLNDLEGKDASSYAFRNMTKLIDKIKAASPETDIVMLSTTYYTQAGESPAKYRTNEVYRAWNESVLQYCNTNSYDYIDLADSMVDEEGYLKTEYAGADGLHLKASQYYDIWIDYLRGYAADKILNQYVNIETMLWK
ncbi:MAG: SGNH/GDSL hydrolase family protein [Eubacteriales bacterium]|nr:SGNH/GDSL hydrolase family protein [Eubacteriales bacterium]MDD4476400.1 SGNH/GDSL hydrolase family protein [Eubacteriales bacterium]